MSLQALRSDWSLWVRVVEGGLGCVSEVAVKGISERVFVWDLVCDGVKTGLDCMVGVGRRSQCDGWHGEVHGRPSQVGFALSASGG